MDDRIKKVLDYVEDNLSLFPSLNDLSRIACLSPSQFHRTFKKVTNRTPFKFIEEIKMNKAYDQLLKGNAMVHELASNMGYNDYETFSRAFKKYFKFSPDDLKGMASKVREISQAEQPEELIIATFEEDIGEEMLADHLIQIIKDRQFSQEDIDNAEIFKIIKKGDSVSDSKNLIKNKYEVTKEKKIWEMLVQKQANESNGS